MISHHLKDHANTISLRYIPGPAGTPKVSGDLQQKNEKLRKKGVE
jgi:hypothetical protein